LVDPEPVPELGTRLEAAVRSGRLENNYSQRDPNQAIREVIPASDELYLEKRVDRESGTVKTIPALVKQVSLMTGEAIHTARMEIGGRNNEPYVALTFNDRGARLFEKITAENVGRQLAIIRDDIVQSAPVIQECIAGGNAQITGNFTPQEANDLAIVLRAGALPAPVDIVQNLKVGPTLGRDSIRNGVASAILGTILVAAFMVIYYRLGLTAFVQIERGKGNLGVDFAGGSMVQFEADQAFALDAVRSAFARHNLTDYKLQDVPREYILMVRTKTAQETVGTVADRIASILSEDLPDQHFVMESKAEIGASVSRDLKRAALIAIVYIWPASGKKRREAGNQKQR